jgi:hypothetical protein
MLLETKNIQENDIIIYTRNSMDENYNFRIVFKNDPKTHHRIISFAHVKKLITEYFPKNLIAYRILCNFPDITIGSVKYGCVIMAENQPELIFTDPVFAVQTIEEYIQHNQNIDFRFKIQQVGYSTVDKVEEKANFQEEFVFDLKVDEAINQNDEIFVMPLLEKRIISRKQKKAGSEIKRNIIFKPENQNKLGFNNDDARAVKMIKEAADQKFSQRYEREAGSEIIYGDSKLILGKIERLQTEKKQIEFPFFKERLMNAADYQLLESSRIFQQNQRKPIREEKLLSSDNPNELRLKFSDVEMNEEEKFKKVKSTAPVIIRKVEITENGSQKQVEMKKSKNHKDDLFSNFLNNLQSESISKIKKKKKKYRESDIIQMFKSVQAASSKKNSDQKHIVLKAGKNGKLE